MSDRSGRREGFADGGGLIPPKLTFANRAFKSLTPFCSGGDCTGSGSATVVTSDGLSAGVGRNLFATA